MENDRGKGTRKPVYEKPAIAVYDYVLMEKGYCSICQTTSSIRHSHFVCCDAPVIRDHMRFYREPEAPQRCKTPLKPEKERIFEE
jgi:hypothetical protein